MLVQKSFRGKEIDPKGPRYPNKTSKLESDLSSQWRSLFLHMEDIFVNEGNHLVSVTTLLFLLLEIYLMSENFLFSPVFQFL